MDAVRSWAMSACLAALAAGIAGMLAPKGNMEKMFRFAVALFFLCSVLAPLLALRHVTLSGAGVSVSSAGTAALSSAVAEQTRAQVRENLENQARAVCKAQGVSPVSVEVDVEQDSGGAYDPKSAAVTLTAADMPKAQAVAAAMQNTLGLQTTVRTGG